MKLNHIQRANVDQLLQNYQDYKKLQKQLAECATRLAKAKLRSENTHDFATEYQELTDQMVALSDSMTFASPVIWMVYKYEAYIDEAQPLITLRDFRLHCSKLGYICTKRYQFLNAALRARNLPPLSSETAYSGDERIINILDAIDALGADERFMVAWREREYYRIDGKVAKWENA